MEGVIFGIGDCLALFKEMGVVPETLISGAAMLAGIGTGIFSSFAEACAQVVTLSAAEHPTPKHTARYEESYTLYRSLYPKLKKSFVEAAQLL